MGVFKHEQLTQAVLDLVTGMAAKLHAAGKVRSLAQCSAGPAAGLSSLLACQSWHPSWYQ